MADFGEPNMAGLLNHLDLALREDRDNPRRQHSFLCEFRGYIDTRIRTAEAAVADAVRRKTPPPRRVSQTMPHATAPTTRVNVDALIDAERREFGERDTPPTFEPGAVINTHPGKER